MRKWKLATLEDDDDLHLKKGLREGIMKYGYDELSENQYKLIKSFSKGNDLIVQATSLPEIMAAYCIGILQQVECSKLECQCLVFAPTKEAHVDDIARVLEKLGGALNVEVGKITQLDNTIGNIVVGSYDHLLNLLRKNEDNFYGVKLLVSDSAASFVDDQAEEIKTLVKRLSKHHKVQVGIFYEKMRPAIFDNITQMIKGSYFDLKIPPMKLTLEGIKKHQFVKFERGGDVMVESLCKIIRKTQYNHTHTIIFVMFPSHAALLAGEIKAKGLTVSQMYTCTTENERNRIKQEFKTQTHVLITTLLYAKSMADVFDRVRYIVNYNFLSSDEYLDYLGWFGEVSATAISFVEQDFWSCIANIQREYNIIFERIEPSEFRGYNIMPIPVDTSKFTRHFKYDFLDEEIEPESLLHMKDEFRVAHISVVFVKNRETVRQVVEILQQNFKGFLICTMSSDSSTNLESPRVFVISDEKLEKAEVEKMVQAASLVINYDVPLKDNYERRFKCCHKNAVVVHFTNTENWYKILGMQTENKVFVTPLSCSVIDFLKDTKPPLSHNAVDFLKARGEK